MNTNLAQLKLAVEAWATDAVKQNMLSEDFIQKIHDFSALTPASLFDSTERPLVVGFFGGTGVGKSSLLNRLAGEDVARTGVERPTSREVTMYLHSTVSVDHLPQEYPVGQIKSAFHNNAANREILWVDMPDFDSAEIANRHLVNEWLPHIDTLIYVVSPERYRDDNGWRLLLQHGGKHAWVFVINHWDRGTPAQREDFRSLLSKAGLDDPHLYCTDSSVEPEADEFAALRTFIQSLANSNTVEQLESRGILMRIRELKALVGQGLNKLGTAEQFNQARVEWDAFWQQESSALLASLGWKYPQLTAQYAAKETGILKSLFYKITGRRHSPELTLTPAPAQTTVAATQLIPDPDNATAAQLFENDQYNSITDDINALVQISARNQLPARAIRSALASISSSLDHRLNNSVVTSRDAALAQPGSALQRGLTRAFSVLSNALPVLALLWAAYRIVHSFYLGGSQPAQYLGSSFAVNAVLLLGLCWLLPWLLARWTKPSLVKAAAKGMHEGARQGLQEIQQEVQQALTKLETDTLACREAGRQLFDTTAGVSEPSLAGDLQRALID